MLIRPSNLTAETALHSYLTSARVVVPMRTVVTYLQSFAIRLIKVALVPVQEPFNVQPRLSAVRFFSSVFAFLYVKQIR